MGQFGRTSKGKGEIPLDDGMHLLMSVFSRIGFLYGDTGLEQLLCDSDVFAAGTAKHSLTGKVFDRAFIILDEVFHHPLLKQF